jgi:hypothetical protein
LIIKLATLRYLQQTTEEDYQLWISSILISLQESQLPILLLLDLQLVSHTSLLFNQEILLATVNTLSLFKCWQLKCLMLHNHLLMMRRSHLQHRLV